MLGHGATLWPEEAIEAIEETSRTLLRDVGVAVQSPRAYDLLKSAGCQPLNGERLSIPWDVVAGALDSLPEEFTLAARNEERNIVVRPGSDSTIVHPAYGQAFVCDAETGAARRANLVDVSCLVRVQHHLEYPHYLSSIVVPDGVPGEIEPLVSFFLAQFESDKCITGTGLWSVDQVRGMCDLAEAILGVNPAHGRFGPQLGFSPLSPLTLGGNVSEALIEAARRHAVCMILPCPVAGTTAPAPLAGALAQAIAEALAGVVVVQTAQPGTPTIFGVRLLGCDPRSGNPTFGGPEVSLTGQVVSGLSRRYGLPSDVYGPSSDSKLVDIQAGFERAIAALSGAMARPTFLSGMGSIQSGLSCAYELLPIDAEILRWVFWSTEERRYDEAALDIKEMERGATSPQGFLSCKQTRAFMRSELVRSSVGYRGPMEGFLASRDSVVARAREQLGEALRAEPVGLETATVDAAYSIITESAGRMGVGDVPDVRRQAEASLAVHSLPTF